MDAVGKGKTILVVDDDALVLRVVQRMLRNSGYSVMVAANGAEALKMFAAAQEQVRLVITDVVMPGMDGATLARELKQRSPALPVLFMSGFPGSKGRLTAPVLGKPFTSATLVGNVRKLLD